MTDNYVGQGRDSEPVPLSAALSGHLFMAVLKAPVAFLLLWLATLLPAVGRIEASSLIVTIIVAYLIGEILTVAVERPFVIKARRPNPGGWNYALLGWWTTPVVGIFVGWLVLGNSAAAAMATFAALAVPATVEVVLSRPWQPGESREEFHQRYEQFKDTTKVTFADDGDEVKRRARDKARNDYYRKHPGEKP